MEKELFILLLNYEFYKENNRKVLELFFPDFLVELYKTLKVAHEKYQKSLSLQELKALHFTKNPALSKTAKDNYELIFKQLENTSKVNPEVAKDIISSLWRQEQARRIAEKAIDVINGKSSDLSSLHDLIRSSVDSDPTELKFKEVTQDLDELLRLQPPNGRWQFNITDLQRAIGGINQGNFVLIPARPETGKTALWISLTAGSDGFLNQGAKVGAFCNEEPGERTMLRLINALTGTKTQDLYENTSRLKGTLGILSQCKVIDQTGVSIKDIEYYVEQERPDIVVVDQLDKISIEGSFARTDELLRALYTASRDICKRQNIVMFAVTQASAGAEGKLFITMDLLENSRTGKAAEADLILAVGKRNTETGFDEPLRTIYVPKNKINGWHGSINCAFDHKLSRYS